MFGLENSLKWLPCPRVVKSHHMSSETLNYRTCFKLLYLVSGFVIHRIPIIFPFLFYFLLFSSFFFFSIKVEFPWQQSGMSWWISPFLSHLIWRSYPTQIWMARLPYRCLISPSWLLRADLERVALWVLEAAGGCHKWWMPQLHSGETNGAIVWGCRANWEATKSALWQTCHVVASKRWPGKNKLTSLVTGSNWGSWGE